MIRIFCKAFLLACAAASIGCESDQAVGPYPKPQDSLPAREHPTFKYLSLSPGALEIEQGATTQLAIGVADQWGAKLAIFSPVTYSTKAPEIATVSDAGLVRGVAPGISSISATVTIGAVTRTAFMMIYVRDTVPSDEVVLLSGFSGWQPSVSHVKAGSIVRWLSGQSSSDPKPTLWLMDAKYSVVDSLDLSSGSATRRFDAPGEIRYCSGGCWDPPDFGTIYIH